MRINRYLSQAGLCSKREVDRWIEQGRVRVNGEPAVLGMRLSESDRVAVDGEPVTSFPEPVYLLYHKPVGVTCTHDEDVEGNLTEAVGYPQKVFAVGRLDKASEGLLLLTNQGELFNKILRAQNGHEKEYIVTVDRPLNDTFLQQMRSGVEILNTVTLPCEVELLDIHRFKITLKQGLNRQIRRMCKALGYRVMRLQRVRIMNLHLDDLPCGQWRPLSSNEQTALLAQLADSAS